MPRSGDQEQQEVVLNWTKEVGNLQQVARLKQEHIVRFVTAFRREDAGKLAHYLLCEWADGGNLLEFWASIPKPELSASLIQDATKQLWGLARAICAAHYLQKLRHGDLKPENILRFRGKGVIGTLKIGDWGLAKFKDDSTVDQRRVTTTGHGSVRYEPPEVKTGVRTIYGDGQNVRSRLYDVWAMGCIILEFVIWLLEGVSGLDAFRRALTRGQDNTPYYVLRQGQLGKNEAVLHKAVTDVMDRIEKKCTRGTALHDLLSLVKDRLLVVKLPRKLAEPELAEGQDDELLHTTPMQRAITFDKRTSPEPEIEGEEKFQGISALPKEMVIERSDAALVQESVAESTFQITIHDVDAGDNVPTSVPLPKEDAEEEGEDNEPRRALATELQRVLKDMVGKENDSSYWMTDASKSPTDTSFHKETVSKTREYSLLAESGGSSRYVSTGTTFVDSAYSTGPSTVPSIGDSSKPGSLGVEKQQDVSIMVDLYSH